MSGCGTLYASLLFGLFLPWTQGCSHFAMENDYRLTVRTMDLATIPFSEWTIMTVPRGSAGLRSAKHGYVAFVEKVSGHVISDLVTAGMNDAGLTCDLQTLLGTKYPQTANVGNTIDAALICKWALEGFASTRELELGLNSVQFVEPTLVHRIIGGAHWAFRDARGEGLVVEFIDGKMQLHRDNNDQGKTGYGIMTNEPPLPWQTQGVRHLQWKQGLARSSVAIPGSWYPDDRFQRIFLVKSGMPRPTTYREAVMQAVHTLNSITVPMGQQLGTDSGKGSGEGSGDHTQWALVYDHKQRIVYWRSAVNQNLQRLQLANAGLEIGSTTRYLAVFSEQLPWFSDAAKALSPRTVGSDEVLA
eukprot:TRINITY_DN78529_c0_g1_i1.p1 TRINITY_DN78529_c0_g1~~TRINITY_DN78529_c0_g1_i1.p1  ORF type:complete len:359 (-),score=46.67 TRINITY_DN78529_c0_g1_i1:64-1140(-)